MNTRSSSLLPGSQSENIQKSIKVLCHICNTEVSLSIAFKCPKDTCNSYFCLDCARIFAPESADFSKKVLKDCLHCSNKCKCRSRVEPVNVPLIPCLSESVGTSRDENKSNVDLDNARRKSTRIQEKEQQHKHTYCHRCRNDSLSLVSCCSKECGRKFCMKCIRELGSALDEEAEEKIEGGRTELHKHPGSKWECFVCRKLCECQKCNGKRMTPECSKPLLSGIVLEKLSKEVNIERIDRFAICECTLEVFKDKFSQITKKKKVDEEPVHEPELKPHVEAGLLPSTLNGNIHQVTLRNSIMKNRRITPKRWLHRPTAKCSADNRLRI